MTRIFPTILGLSFITLPVGCGSAPADGAADTEHESDSNGSGEAGSGSDETAGALVLDDAAILELALAYGTFTRVTDAPRDSMHGLADTVHVWVPDDLVEPYAMVVGSDAPPAFSPGALLVKEHLDAAGAYAGLTLMYKGEPGLAPESADWWWGRVTADDALANAGQVKFCVDCHSAAATTGFVFGVTP